MALLDALGSILQTAGVGTLGTTIFLSRIPDSPDSCVTVVESGSGNAMYTMRSSGAALYETNVQVNVRSGREDYPTGRATIDTVVAAFEAVDEQTISGFRILRIEQLGRPVSLGYDHNDRPKLAMNFTVTHA